MTKESESKEGMKGLSVGRSDLYRMKPEDLFIKEGWNSRVKDFDPEDPEDLALAASISEVGVKQPLTVYWEDGKTYISDGHRRYFATLYAIEHGAEIASIQVQKEDRYASEGDRVFSQIVRNSGKPLAPIEQAKVFKRLIDLGWNEKDISIKSGLARQRVVELLELQAAPSAVTELVKEGAISSTLAISTMRKHKGDMTKVAADMNNAVQVARESGKTRATAKHMAEKPTPPRATIKAILEASDITDAIFRGQAGYNIVMSADDYAQLRHLAGI